MQCFWSEAAYPGHEVSKQFGKSKSHMPTFSCVMKDREEFIRITIGLNEDIIAGRI